MKAVVAIVLLFHTLHASALCLNPFGCPPTTKAECVAQTKDAKTEASVRALLLECNKLPEHTLAECKSFEDAWKTHMRVAEGKE